jgi:hypothetical protein
VINKSANGFVKLFSTFAFPYIFVSRSRGMGDSCEWRRNSQLTIISEIGLRKFVFVPVFAWATVEKTTQLQIEFTGSVVGLESLQIILSFIMFSFHFETNETIVTVLV